MPSMALSTDCSKFFWDISDSLLFFRCFVCSMFIFIESVSDISCLFSVAFLGFCFFSGFLSLVVCLVACWEFVFRSVLFS